MKRKDREEKRVGGNAWASIVHNLKGGKPKWEREKIQGRKIWKEGSNTLDKSHV